MPDAEVAAIADRVIAGRMSRPDGPGRRQLTDRDGDDA